MIGGGGTRLIASCNKVAVVLRGRQGGAPAIDRCGFARSVTTSLRAAVDELSSSYRIRSDSCRSISNLSSLTSPHTTPAIRSSSQQQQQQRRSLTVVQVSQHKAEDISQNSNAYANTNATAEGNNESDVVVKVNKSSDFENEEKQELNITPSCWKRIKYLASKKGMELDQVYLRLYVDAGGCSGFTYKFELDAVEDEPINDGGEDDGDDEKDVVFTCPDGVTRVVVDESTIDLIKGSTIDYVESMIKSTFEVRENPQSESACGCGSSFAIKNFQSNPAVD